MLLVVVDTSSDTTSVSITVMVGAMVIMQQVVNCVLFKRMRTNLLETYKA